MKTTIKALLIIAAMFAAPTVWAQDNIFYPPVYNNGGQIIAAVASTGACPTGSCVGISIPGPATTITIGVTGTFSATLQPEESQNGGYTWTSAGSAITSAGTTVYTITGFTNFRVRASAYVSGVANVNIQAGPTGGNGSATAGVTSLNGLVGGVTLAAGSNITITPSGNTLTIASSGGSGCTASGAAGVIQASNGTGGCQATSITDDGTTTVTFGAETVTLASALDLVVPKAAGFIPPDIGGFGYDSTARAYVGTRAGLGGSGIVFANFLSGFTFTNGDCLSYATNVGNGSIQDTGAPCASSTIAFPVTVSGTTTSGGIPYFSSTTVLTSSALLAANQLILGGGAGTAPATLGSLGTTTTVLHGNAAGAPSFGAVNLAADVSGQLPISAVGSSGLSGTSPIAISAAGAISCATCVNIDLTAAGSTWYPFGIWTPMTGSPSIMSLTAINDPEMYLITLPVTAKVTNVTVVTAGSAAVSAGDIGMYSISGTTATLVWHTGSFATTSNNTSQIITLGTPVTLNPGKYYIATCNSVNTVTTAGVVNTTTANNTLLSAANPAHSWGQNATDLCTVGVLPNTQTTTNITNSGSANLNGVFVKITN